MGNVFADTTALRESKAVNIRVEGISSTIISTGENYTTNKTTVYEAVYELLSNNNIPIVATDSQFGKYVSSINNISAGIFGGFDGWMYAVNNTESSISMDTCNVNTGDNIVVYYGGFSPQTYLPQIILSDTNIVKGSNLTVSIQAKYFDWNTNSNVTTKISGAQIKLSDKTYLTDENGQAVITVPDAAGDYTIEISQNRENNYPLLVRTTEKITVLESNPSIGYTVSRQAIVSALERASDKLIEKFDDTSFNYQKHWMAIGINGCDKKAPDSYLQGILDGDMPSGNSGQYGKYILGILAAGGDPTNVNGRNLLDELCRLSDMKNVSTQGGIYTTPFGLLALDAVNYEIPEDAGFTRDDIINKLVTLANPKGGEDGVGFVLTALGRYYDKKTEVKTAVDNVISAWADRQGEDGGFGAGAWSKESNVNTSAQVLMGLSFNGKDPQSAEFTKAHGNLISYILSLQNEDGTFNWQKTESGSISMATEQAVYALAQYLRQLDGKKNIYEFSKEEYEFSQLIIPDEVNSGEDFTLKLIDGKGQPLKDKWIILECGNTYIDLTDANGVLKTKINKAGIHKIIAAKTNEYGNPEYDQNGNIKELTSKNIKVKLPEIKISCKDTVKPKESFKLSVTADGKPLSGAPIKFGYYKYENLDDTGNSAFQLQTTDINGEADLSLDAPPGEYKLFVAYNEVNYIAKTITVATDSPYSLTGVEPGLDISCDNGSTAVLDGKIYIFKENEIRCFDPVKNVINKLENPTESLPWAKDKFVVGESNNGIFILGRSTNEDSTNKIEVYKYDEKNNSITDMGILPGFSEKNITYYDFLNHSSLSIDGKIYFPLRYEYSVANSDGIKSSVEIIEFDPSDMQKSVSIASIRNEDENYWKFTDCTVAASGHKIYVFGGNDNSDVLMIDLDSNTKPVLKVKDFMPLCNSSAAELNGELYLFGGRVSTFGYDFYSTLGTLYHIFKFNPTNNTIEPVSYLPSQKIESAAQRVNDSIYILGGSGTKDIIKFNDTSKISIKISSSTNTIKIGDTLKLNSSVLDGSGNTVQGKDVLWSSSNNEIAKITQDGLVTAVAQGTVQIIAYLKENKQICSVFDLNVASNNTTPTVEQKNEATVYLRVEGYNNTILPRTSIKTDIFDLNSYLTKPTGSSAASSTGWGIDKFKHPTVAHALVKALNSANIKYELQDYGWSLYIAMINGESEFDQSGTSGWMYRVNDHMPNVGCQATEIKDGDEIVWYYGTGFDTVYSKIQTDKTAMVPGEEVTITLNGIKTDMSGNQSGATSKEPVSGATIYVNNEPYKVGDKFLTTDSQGKAKIKIDNPGTYVLSAEKSDSLGQRLLVRPQPVTITVASNSSNVNTSPQNSITNEPTKIPGTEISTGPDMVPDTKVITVYDEKRGKAIGILSGDSLDNFKKSISSGQTNKSNIASITLISRKDIRGLNLTIPYSAVGLLGNAKNMLLEIRTDLGYLTFDRKAIDSIITSADSKDITISISKVDINKPSKEIKDLVGIRPVKDISINAGNKKISSLNGNINIKMPYVLGAGEDKNAVVACSIDDSERVKTISGIYNSSAGAVYFSVNSLGKYAVGYNKATFIDVNDTGWYKDAVVFCTARGIAKGIGNNKFNPEGILTRGQFIVMLMSAYDINTDENVAENTTANFTDAGKTYYTKYLAAAKRLGIAKGVGGNMFRPESSISRQDMFTLLYNTLLKLGKLPEALEGKNLKSYKDISEISDYAKTAIETFVSSGAVVGNNMLVKPKDTMTRSQMVQVLYNLLRHD